MRVARTKEIRCPECGSETAHPKKMTASSTCVSTIPSVKVEAGYPKDARPLFLSSDVLKYEINGLPGVYATQTTKKHGTGLLLRF